MEHILQFAINIDDNTIKQNIEAKAEKQVIEQLVKDVKSSIIDKWGSLTFTSENIIRTETNSQCMFELGLRNYPKNNFKS